MGSNLFVIANGFPFVTSDLGDTWTSAGTIPSDANATRLLSWNGKLLLSTDYYWILISRDAGTTWGQFGTDNLKEDGAGAVFAIGDTLFANTAGSVLRTNDGGNSWTFMDRLQNDTAVEQFSLDGDYLFVGCTRGGVFRSSDKGTSWVLLTPFLAGIEVNGIATNGPIVFAATWGLGIYRSTDYGDHWEAVNNGFSQLDVRAICFSGDTVFAGFNHGAGIFMSTDSGRTWHDVNEGLTDRTIGAFWVWQGYLFAGGGGSSGVWRRSLSDFSGVREGVASKSELVENYPNPTTSNTTIRFTLNRSGVARLSVVDILGREVTSLESRQMSAGENSVVWDASHLPCGVYFYRLVSGTLLLRKQFIVSR
jgi:photosystem II stability/assembly factor-like uncharacterized protein